MENARSYSPCNVRFYVIFPLIKYEMIAVKWERSKEVSLDLAEVITYI